MPAVARPLTATPSNQALSVLVIDDDPDVRDSISEVLRDAGYRVVCAEHGQQALERLAKGPPPAAIVLDLFMPRMNGWEFAKEVSRRFRFAQIPIIVMTASAPHWGAPVAQERVLRKPFQSSRLLGLIKTALSPS